MRRAKNEGNDWCTCRLTPLYCWLPGRREALGTRLPVILFLAFLANSKTKKFRIASLLGVLTLALIPSSTFTSSLNLPLGEMLEKYFR